MKMGKSNSWREIKPEWKNVNNLPDILRVNHDIYPDNTAVQNVSGTAYSYGEMEAGTRYIASMLSSTGLGKGDRVAILSENSAHWTIAYFGILAAGISTVPILPDFRASEVYSILEHSGAKALFVSSKLISRLEEGLPPELELLVCLNDFSVLDLERSKNGTARVHVPENSKNDLTRLDDSIINGERSFPGEKDFYKAHEDDLAAIIYTSGTTGRSKGVMLSHKNILSNGMLSATIHNVKQDDRFLSMLPLAHTYECTIGMVVPLLNGATIHYIEKPPTAAYLTPLLKKIRPTTMLTVPLIIEKIFAARIKPALYGKPLTRSLMKLKPTRLILSRAASRKLQSFFGGEVRFFGIGGAPLSPEVEAFLLDGKFPYAIGYGLTETSPMLAGFNPAGAVYKSVGTVMGGIDLRINDPDPLTGEGEIVAKGPSIMLGYFKDEEKTSEVFTDDGYFRTGDLGYINSKGILYIRGRLKNMILGPNGENIYPEEIEAVINREDLVTESLVQQVQGKLVARVHLNMEALEDRFKHLKENAAEFQQQIQVRADEILEEIMLRVNTTVARNSRLQLMILQVQPFEKTPTQKIKRFLYQ